VANVDDNTCRIDDFGPLPVAKPRTVAEVGDLVRRAAADKQAIYPIGGQTLLGIGLPPTRPGVAVDIRGLSQVVDYPARDMTITVQAGITVAELQRLLATEKQRLPLDVPHAERATLGGVLATNVSGSHRLGFGTLRDYVIGISTVNDEGCEVKAGGRVVKNVAGYDLCKLHIGALGTLGIISQVTLKLRPLPESKALVAFGCETAALDRLLDRLHESRTRPVCVDVLNRETVRALVHPPSPLPSPPQGGEGWVRGAAHLSLPEAPWVIAVGFEDNSDAVSWQIRQLLQELSPGDIAELEARAGETSETLWQALVEAPAGGERLTFKANLLPHAVAAFCRQADTLAEPIRLHAHAGSGIVHGHLDGDLTLSRVSAMLKELTDAAVRAEGNLVLPRCPVEWKRALPIWGRERGDLWLMRQVKDKLDPHHLFNPGRFIEAI
jgi:glycolate oxidase FAD binding subunit